jgi:hypothetical protein
MNKRDNKDLKPFIENTTTMAMYQTVLVYSQIINDNAFILHPIYGMELYS